MAAFVVDASMAMAWHFADEETPATLAVENLTDDHGLVVPGHWYAELCNALLVGERRKRATLHDSAAFIARIGQFDVEVDELAPALYFDRVLPLARAHRLTVYDALYLEVAERRGLPLASLDEDLNAAAASVGVSLVAAS